MTAPLDRRDLFSVRRWRRAVGDLQYSIEDSVEVIERLASEPVVTYRRQAMACDFEFQFAASETQRRVALDAFELVDQLESQLTVYRDDSEVSLINATGFPGPVAVEPQLFALIQRCQRLSRETQGAFDITAGPLVRAWGFRWRDGRVPEPADLDAARRLVGMDQVELRESDHSLAFKSLGMEINFGAVGKGHSLDRVAPLFKEAGFRATLLSAGHSSMLANGRPSWDDAWTVDVRAPLEPERRLAKVRLTNQGFSTSGVAEQYFTQEGRRYGHLIDPRNGQPVEGMLQVSVVAPDATRAEALSTAFFVLGVEWARIYCRRNPDVGALMIPDPGAGRELRPVILGAIDARII